jgi:predicted dehydrogenase
VLESGAVASIFYRGGVSRGDNFRWEINGSKGDLVLTSPLGNLQVLAPTLLGGQDEDTSVAPLAIPAEYDLASDAPEGPAANVARLYAAFATDLRNGTPGQTAPDFAHALRLHRTQDLISAAAASGIAQHLTERVRSGAVVGPRCEASSHQGIGSI